MSALMDGWKEYCSAVYPEGISGAQERECRQAYFCACLSMVRVLSSIAELPMEKAAEKLQELYEEALTECERRALEITREHHNERT